MTLTGSDSRLGSTNSPVVSQYEDLSIGMHCAELADLRLEKMSTLATSHRSFATFGSSAYKMAAKILNTVLQVMW